MKHLVEYINESSTPHFVDTFRKELKKLGVDEKVSTWGPRDEMTVSKDGVKLSWLNGVKVQYAPRTLHAGSVFDNEPAYISITDKLSANDKLKGLFDELMKEGLDEATRGRNAQWGTWKFAVRSDVDVNKIIKALKNNKLI